MVELRNVAVASHAGVCPTREASHSLTPGVRNGDHYLQVGGIGAGWCADELPVCGLITSPCPQNRSRAIDLNIFRYFPNLELMWCLSVCAIRCPLGVLLC